MRCTTRTGHRRLPSHGPQQHTGRPRVAHASDAGAPYAWLAKRGAHRSITPVRRLADLEAQADEEPLLLQRRVAPPLLIDGHAFDLGVYVGVARRADGTLATAIFDDVLLRFCAGAYEEAPAAATLDAADSDNNGTAAQLTPERLRRAWLVEGGSYLAAWNVPSLQPHLRRTAAEPAPSRAALAAHLSPLRWARVWRRVREAVAATASVAAMAAAAEAPQGRATSDAAATAATARFELVRYDFVLDAADAPFLIEVNSWPNMVPLSEGQTAQLNAL
jgi:hypothetical protein